MRRAAVFRLFGVVCNAHVLVLSLVCVRVERIVFSHTKISDPLVLGVYFCSCYFLNRQLQVQHRVNDNKRKQNPPLLVILPDELFVHTKIQDDCHAFGLSENFNNFLMCSYAESSSRNAKAADQKSNNAFTNGVNLH